ncbi:MAG: alpha/beta hydrolase [Pseudomonadales bacterium]|nr:alpha/beta hydrolase [Pseudomonadales bacterium]
MNRNKLEVLFARKISAEVIPIEFQGVKGEWVLAKNAQASQRLLYIHGGGFIVGSTTSHRYIASELSKSAGVAVLSINYRMLPDYKIIDSHADVRTAYRWIFNNGPSSAEPAKNVFIAGDSAGGTLCLAAIAWARDNKLPRCTAAIGLAPLTDITLSGPSLTENISSDPFLGPFLKNVLRLPRTLIAIAARYKLGAAINDPEISPLLGNLANLPPTLLQVSNEETLFSDSLRYANKANSAGSEVILQVWPAMVHVFQAFGPKLPEAIEAFKLIGEFIQARMKETDKNP